MQGTQFGVASHVQKRDRRLRHEICCTEGFGKIGNEDVVVPILIEAIKGNGVNNIKCRGAAAFALGEMGPKAKIAIPVLLESLQESVKLGIEDPRNIWRSALEGLEGIGSNENTVVLTIGMVVSDPKTDMTIRKRSKQALECALHERGKYIRQFAKLGRP